MDINQFKKMVDSIASNSQTTVVALHEPGVTPNFFAAELLLRPQKTTLFLLCSREQFWALSEVVDSSGLCFVDHAPLTNATQLIPGLGLLTASELNGSFSPRQHMLPSDIKYWKPQTLGEALFNWWD